MKKSEIPISVTLTSFLLAMFNVSKWEKQMLFIIRSNITHNSIGINIVRSPTFLSYF